jgi:penicillin G amidase
VDNDRGEVPEVVFSEEEFSDAQIRKDAELDLGSNNWAVSPSKSATGNAFLCNDTHLSLRLPGTWYQMNVRIGDEIMAGFTVIGSPGIISGYTNHVAWGMTNATWDFVDFYELELNSTGQYSLDEEWKELERFEESFAVKGGSTITRTFHESAFGPMDSLNDKYLAVQWVGMLTGTQEMLAFAYLQKAKNIEEAFDALAYFNHPPQNFILADSKGNIGLATTGFAAIHPAPTRGIAKANSTKDLPQYVQMNRWLHEFNPQRGWTGSANQNQVSDTLSAYLSTRFSPNSRGKRLKQMMEERAKISREDLMAMHTDAKDLEWDLGRDHFLRVCKPEWLETMQAWDGVCDTNSVAATIYQEYRFELSNVLVAKLGNMKLTPQSEYVLHLVSTNEQLPTPSGAVSSVDLAREAISNVEKKLSAQMGYDWKSWTYGKYHMTNVAHITGLPALSQPAFASNGSGRTLLANSGIPSEHGPSMRTIIEFTPKGPVVDMVLTGGQSGRVNSPNYADQLATWNAGKYYRVNIPPTFESKRYLTIFSSK